MPMPCEPSGRSVRLAQRAALHWYQWAGEFVVFDEASGRTHLLDAWAACALLNVERAPVDLQLLARQVARDMHVDDDTVAECLPSILEQLAGIGLIEVASQ
jgi:PqqD family protein of HPr-rel-A system